MTILSAIEYNDNDKTWNMCPFMFKWNGGKVDLSFTVHSGPELTIDDIISTKTNSPVKTKTNCLASGWAMEFEFSQHYQLENFTSTLLQDMKLAARNCAFELFLCYSHANSSCAHTPNLGM